MRRLRTRRNVLAGVATAATGGLAGCASVPLIGQTPPWETDFGEQTKQQARQVGRTAQRAVVRLGVTNGICNWGTGWHLGDGHIVTNAELLPTDESETVPISWLREDQTESEQIVEGEVLGRSDVTREEALDIGLLQTPLSDLPSLSYKPSTDISPEEPLISVSHPTGAPEWSILLGSFIQYGMEGFEEDWSYPSDAHITAYLPTGAGMEGSPVLTLDGEVVGCYWRAEMPADMYVKSPKYVHTSFSDHPGMDLSIHSARFKEYFNRWR